VKVMEHSQTFCLLNSLENIFAEDDAFNLPYLYDKDIENPLDWLLRFNYYSILRDEENISSLKKIEKSIFSEKFSYLSAIASFNHNLRISASVQDFQSLVSTYIRDINLFPENNRIFIAKSLHRSKAFLELLALTETLQFNPPVKAPPCTRMLIAMMVKDEGDIIFLNLHHHYNLGCRNFFILLNGCTDNTFEEILRFMREHEQSKVIFINDPVVAYHQKEKMSHLIEYALNYLGIDGPPVDIILPLDADEFFSFEASDHDGFKGLFEKMDKLSYTALVAPLIDVFGEISHNLSQSSFYESVSNIASPAVFSGIKMLFRSGRRRHLVQGNHFLSDVNFKPGSYGFFSSFGGFIAHFQYRSIEHVISKVSNGGLAYANKKIDKNLGVHWRDDYQKLLLDPDSFAKSKIDSYNTKIANSHSLLKENLMKALYKSSCIKTPKNSLLSLSS
jgi:hypothetical protein